MDFPKCVPLLKCASNGVSSMTERKWLRGNPVLCCVGKLQLQLIDRQGEQGEVVHRMCKVHCQGRVHGPYLLVCGPEGIMGKHHELLLLAKCFVHIERKAYCGNHDFNTKIAYSSPKLVIKDSSAKYIIYTIRLPL